MTEWLRKLRGWLRRTSIEVDLREEMRTHLEMKADDIGDMCAARRAFGNTTQLLEDSRAAWGWPQLEGWVRDFRYGLRMMIRRPGFSAAVVVTLALGIGASSTVFSLIDTVLLRPLRYPGPDRLTAVFETKPSDDVARTPVAPGRLEDWQRLSGAFEALAGSRTDTLTEATGPEPERISSAFVSPRFFAVLGTPAELGRAFQEHEERFGGPDVAVISDGLWRRRYATDRTVLGRSLALEGQRFTIVGVMPPTFQHPSSATEVWVADRPPANVLRLREARFYQVIGRLKTGVSVAQGQTDLANVQSALGRQYPKTDAGWSVAVRSLKDELTGSVRLALWLLVGSVGTLLLIACANVACLLLSQLNGRGVEIATRLALGAGRGAIARQLVAEGFAYAVAGGLLGLGATLAAVDVLQKRLTGIPRMTELAVDVRLLGFIVVTSVSTAVLFSLAPVLQTFRRNVATPGIRGGRSIAGGSQWLPRVLVGAQLALATVLLVGAGLFFRSLMRLQETPLGFYPEKVLTLRVSASFGEQPATTLSRHQRTLDAVAALHGVTSVAMASGIPGVNATWPREFQIAGEPSPDGTLQFAGWRIVTDGYFQTVGIPILAGRTCRMTTETDQAFELLVNRSFADRYLKGRDPAGRTVLGGPIGNGISRIVGMVGDVKEDGVSKDATPVIYACGYLRFWPDSPILVRTVGDPAGMMNVVRQAIRGIEPARPVYALRPLREAMSETLVQDRSRSLLVSLFSAMGLTLAGIGLYGVMAYMVTQRTKEIGVRIALGARPGQILSQILLSAATLTIGGGIVGFVLAALASRFVGSLLYGIPSFDTTTYLAATSVLIVVAFLACLIPVRRATSIDPVRALRE